MTRTTKIKGLILAGALVLAGTITSAQGRGCYTAEIPGAVVLPDGSRHEAGALRICTGRTLSPVSTLNRIFVGGKPTGMFRSTPRAIEEHVSEGAAQFIFERGVGDGLNLVGYVVSGRNGTTIYEMARPEVLRADAGARNETVVLIASAR